jgi:hypothetical protein
MKEKDFALEIIKYLEYNKYTIYKEVPLKRGIIDIVATNHWIWGIETKTYFSLALIAQVLKYKEGLDKVSIAVPWIYENAIKKASFKLFKQLCKWYGIGILTWNGETVKEVLKPVFNIRVNPILLRAEYKNNIAGSKK